ncbi:MAG: DUF2628 domain-containing protein [Rhodomicrobium sp.]|jgi:hypothetical protein
MIIYTVHESQRPAESIEARSEGVVFVKEGFTIWGFLFGPFWLLYNRLWFEFIAALVLSATLGAVLMEFGPKEQAAAIVDLLLALLIGFEGNELLRWNLQRKGYAFLGAVVGRTRLECERRFFDAWIAHVKGGGGATPVADLKSGDWRMPTTVGGWPEAAV